MRSIIQFIKEAYAELKKVQWPTQKELIRYTIAVVAISILVAIFLGALDQVFRSLVEVYILNIRN